MKHKFTLIRSFGTARINTNYLLIVFFICIFSVILLLFSSCNKTKIEEITVNYSLEKEPEIKPVQRYELTLVAAGDNLFHEPIINTHRQRDGSFNFNPIYEEIKDIIQSADLAFINQETVMAGSSFGYSGYPAFNSPQSLASTLKDTGFDILNIANNHAMDMGRTGLYNTLDFLETINGITVLGARKSGKSWRIITRNNISLGFLSYTYSLNGIPLPPGEPNLVSTVNRTRMSQEINELRQHCDFLIVSMHWGEEYRLVEPDSVQKDLAEFLASLNVDIIIGHHPHVLQRVELLPRQDGKETICFYSLGNFVSNQREKDRVLGGMIAVTFTKEYADESEIISISDYGLIPVVTHFEAGYTNTKAYPFYLYTEELLQKHLLHLRDRSMTFDYFNSILNRLDVKIIMNNPF